MELMSPLPKHEGAKKAIGDLIATLAVEWAISAKVVWFGNLSHAKRKPPAANPMNASDFAKLIPSKAWRDSIRLFIVRRICGLKWTSLTPPFRDRSMRLGVPEVWRYSGDRLTVRLLTSAGIYADSATSRAFPFLPLVTFAGYIPRMIEQDETHVLRDFREWVGSLPQ